jgi:protein TonB
MITNKNPKFDLRFKYKKTLELSTVVGLAFLVLIFQAFKRFDSNVQQQKQLDIKISVQEIPQTEQIKRPPSPTRPAVPVESEDSEVPEDATIETTDIDLSELPPPPPPPTEDEIDDTASIFVAYDEPPEPIGGFAAIQEKLVYPEIARKAGVEGRVYVQVIIDEKGNVVKATVTKSLGNNGCDEAAVLAIKSVKWRPAKQRDKPVKVSVGIPVVFKLK